MTWPTKKLGESLRKVPKVVGVLTKDYLDEGKFPIVDQGQSFVAGYTNNTASVYDGELPVVVFGDHTRAVKFIDFSFAVGADGTKILKPTSEFDAKFFYYFLLSIDIPARGYARHYSLLRESEIPVPSIVEQRKIVARVEKQFAKIDEAARLRGGSEAATAQILPAALHEIFSQAKLEGWKDVTLESLIDEIRTGPFGSALHKSDYVADGIPVINPQDISGGTIVALGKTMISEKTRNRLRQYMLQEGDIIFARRGEMGRCAVVTKKETGWLCGTGSLILRLSKKTDARFVASVLSSAKIRRVLEGVSVGTTMSNLNQSILNKIKIPLPPLAEQKEIVKKLDALSEKTKTLAALQSAQAVDLKALKQSILHEAFSGGHV